MDLKEFLEQNPEFAGVTAEKIQIPKATPIKKEKAVVGEPIFTPMDGGGIMVRVPFYYPAFAPEAERKVVFARIFATDPSWLKGNKPVKTGNDEADAKTFRSYGKSIGRLWKGILNSTGGNIENAVGKIVIINADPIYGQENELEVSYINPYKEG